MSHGIPVTDFSVLPRLTEQTITTAAPRIAASAILIAVRLSGGVSLFGGRGKAVHGVLGGLLIGGIAYGVSLLSLGSLSTPLTYILPGGVLLIAVLIDVQSRRGSGSVTRV